MQIQYVILKVRLLSNKISGKKIDFSLEVHKTEISQMDHNAPMCGKTKNNTHSGPTELELEAGNLVYVVFNIWAGVLSIMWTKLI